MAETPLPNSEQMRDHTGALEILTEIYRYRISDQHDAIPGLGQLKRTPNIVTIPFERYPLVAENLNSFLTSFEAEYIPTRRSGGVAKIPLSQLVETLKMSVGLGSDRMFKVDIAEAQGVHKSTITYWLRDLRYFLADYSRNQGASQWRQLVESIHFPLDLELS